MKRCGALFALTAVVQINAATLKTTPMARVASLLNELRARIESDGKMEQMSYDKYACWCEDTLGRKAQDINTAKEDIAAYQTEIIKFKGEIGSHGAEIKHLQKDIAGNVESQREASTVRSKDKAGYVEDKTESEQCIGALEAAIKVLTGTGEKRGFLETMKEAQLLSVAAEVRGVLEQPTAVHSVGHKEFQLVKQFVERPEDFIGSTSGFLSATQITNNPFGDYAPQSTQIQGILKGMYEAFASGLEKSNAEEADAQKSFEDLMVIKQQELATLQSTLDHHQLQLATKTSSLAEKNERLDDTKAQLDADEGLFAETKSGCKQKAGEWSERTRLRTEELAGVGQAIGILTDPNSVQVFTKSTTTFVQVTSVRQRSGARSAMYSRISQLATRFHSLSLAHLAVQVMSGGHFDAVIASIDDMIAALRKEEQEDIDHRDRCQHATAKSANDKEDLGHAIDKADASILVLDGDETKLTAKVGTLEGDIELTKQEIQQALDMRTSEVGEFQQTLKDDADAIALLEETIAVLSRFYKSNRTPMSLVATDPEYTTDPDKAPETSWSGGNYGGRNSETHGIVNILEMIKDDVAKEMNTAREDDAKSQRQFEKQRSAMQETMDAQVTLKLGTEKELSDVEQKLADTNGVKSAKSKDLDAENELGNAISTDCSWVDTHFDSRRTKRAAEIDGLNAAKGFLAGVDSGV